MPANQYKNKKVSLVIPNDIYKVIENIAEDDERTVSSVAVRLIREALISRGLIEPRTPRTTD